jgi:hypothetical protein
MRRTIPALLSGILLLVLAGAAAAQKGKAKTDPNVRGVEGVVVDPKGAPVKGAVVQLKDARTLAVRSFFTQENGEYRFSGLSRDTDYELRATYQDLASDTKRLTIFDTRATARINLELQEKK